MLQKNITALFLCLTSLILSQTNTEVFLFDLKVTNATTYELVNGKNISNNEGYDNQPSFVNDNQILFASTRNGQTDILEYRDNYGTKTWLNFTEGGEYTPLKIPNNSSVSAVRLDKDGKQRLYSYKNGESSELIKDLVVAYYTWYNKNVIVSAVIEDINLNLYASNLKEGWNKKYDTKVGRSFHKIPNSNLVSYISKKDSLNWTINSLNPLTGETQYITRTMSGIEDICWLINGSIISGKGSKLYRLNPVTNSNWQEIADLKDVGISKITRIASNSISSKLLIAAEIGGTIDTNNDKNDTNQSTSTVVSPIEAIVQRNLKAYNAKDIDAFMKDYADDVKTYTYPNELRTDGKKAMRKDYENWFEKVKQLKAVILKRIVIGNKVIDHEEVSANGQTFKAVAIYEIKNGLINKVTFIQ